MANFILLDIDGVMVKTHSWRHSEMEEDGFYRFSEEACAIVNDLLEDTDAEIILTSSHRKNFTLEQWTEIFNKRLVNFTSVKLIDDLNFYPRHMSIMDWANNQTANFVIFDDDLSLAQLPDGIRRRWVKTHSMLGLTGRDYYTALEILKNNNNENKNRGEHS